jgi:hypothetical protein
MSNATFPSSKWLLIGVSLAALAAITLPAPAQDAAKAPAITVGNTRITGLPDDWSHRHLIFSDPGAEEDAIINGTHEKWLKIVNNPRYVIQQLKWNGVVRGPSAAGVDLRREWEAGAASGLQGRATSDAITDLRLPSPIDPLHRIKPVSNIKKDWSMSMGSASATVGADHYPAKYSFAVTAPTTANCASGATPDFVVYNTGVAGSGSQPSIIAYDNLYVNSGGTGLCTGTAPSVYWAFDLNGYTIASSPVLSLAGDQVAFVTNSTFPASLVLLKWKAGSGTLAFPTVLAVTGAASYRNCTAPCMTTIGFSGTNSDTISSPFYDYAGDAIYVGDAAGNLEKFSNIFLSGTPTWSWTTNTSNRNTTSAVFDDATGYAYSTNYTTNISAVNASGVNTVGPAISDPTGGNNSNDIQEGPVVDPVAGEIYVFGEGNTDNYVAQVATAGFSSSSTVTYVQAGASANNNADYFYAGTFDNNFYSTGTGNLYVCGHNGADATLYQIPITAGAMATTANAGPALTTATDQCSPVTEIYNNSGAVPYDWIYLGVRGAGAPSGCGGGACVMNVPVTGWVKSTAYALGQMIVNSNFNIEVVTTAGTSSSTQPTWPAAGTIGTVTSDGSTLKWTSLGPFTFTAFTPSHDYAVNQVIVDGNNNLERVTTCTGACESNTTAPSWATTFGSTTTSTHGAGNSVTFTEEGPLGINGEAYTGGTSGIIVDNISTAAATSNIYFSTLSSETCTTSGGTAGCAVQASQSAP